MTTTQVWAILDLDKYSPTYVQTWVPNSLLSSAFPYLQTWPQLNHVPKATDNISIW